MDDGESGTERPDRGQEVETSGTTGVIRTRAQEWTGWAGMLLACVLSMLPEVKDRRVDPERWGDALASPIRKGVVAALGVLVMSQPGAAQSYCDEGIGLLIADTQIMLWEFLVGVLVIVLILGVVLRAIPIFAGATAIGNVMLVAVIVGVVGFVFVLTFIDVALGYVGGPEVASSCSPFL